MKERFLSLTRAQRVTVLIQVFVLLISAVLYFTIGRQRCTDYMGKRLMYDGENGVKTYSGEYGGKDIEFRVLSAMEVEYRENGEHKATYTIKSDQTAVPDIEELEGGTARWRYAYDGLLGIEIYKDTELIFRGAYNPASYLHGSTLPARLYAENGEVINDLFDEPKWEGEPGPGTIRGLTLTPKLYTRGDFMLFAMVIIIGVMNLISILYADELFRFNLKWTIKDPERAEPSEWVLFGRWVGWVFILILTVVFAVVGLFAK